MKIGEIYKATKEDITKLMDQMEKEFGPSTFRQKIEQKLVEELVENGWEIKKSPVEGFDNNIEYLFSLFKELYQVTKELAEEKRAYAETLVNFIPLQKKQARAVEENRKKSQELYLKTNKPANDLPG